MKLLMLPSVYNKYLETNLFNVRLDLRYVQVKKFALC